MRQKGYSFTAIVCGLLCILLLQACSSGDSVARVVRQEFSCRDEGECGREPMYCADVPEGWVRHDSAAGESITDTTRSLCAFTINDGDAVVRVTIHNFPSDHVEERVPPGAQVARWKRQFAHLDTELTTQQAYGGFSGLRLEAVGVLPGSAEPTMVLAWGMQLAHEHYSRLLVDGAPLERHHYKQMRADYTIKAVGPVSAVQRHKRAIVRFARSFGLIDEIPVRQ